MIFQMSVKSLKKKMDRLRFDMDWRDTSSNFEKSGIDLQEVNAALMEPKVRRKPTEEFNENQIEDDSEEENASPAVRRNENRFFKCSIGACMRKLTSCLLCSGR